jgi:hypothetical protein
MHHLPARREKVVKVAGDDNKEKLREGINDTLEFKDRIAVLTIAYHNLAVEQEFMYMVSKIVTGERLLTLRLSVSFLVPGSRFELQDGTGLRLEVFRCRRLNHH